MSKKLNRIFQVEFLQQGRALLKLKISDLSKIKSGNSKIVADESVPIKIDTLAKIDSDKYTKVIISTDESAAGKYFSTTKIINKADTEFKVDIGDAIYSSIINKIINNNDELKMKTDEAIPLTINSKNKIIDLSTGKLKTDETIHIIPANRIVDIINKAVVKIVTDELEYIEIDLTSFIVSHDEIKLNIDDVIAIDTTGYVGLVAGNGSLNPALIQPDLIFISQPSKIAANGTAKIIVLQSFAYLVDFEGHFLEEINEYTLWDLNYKIFG